MSPKHPGKQVDESEQKFVSIFHASPDAIIISRQSDGLLIELNESWEKVTGYTRAEALGRTSLTLGILQPEQRNRLISEFRKLGTLRDHEMEIRHKSGESRQVSISASQIELDGQACLLTIMRDISERRQAERALEKSKRRLHAFFDQSLDGFFFCDFEEPIPWKNAENREETLEYIIANKRFTDVNEAMLKQYGISREGFLNLTTKDIFAHDLEQGRALRRQLFDNGHLHLETHERTSDGTPVWFEGAYVCLYDSEGRITGFFGIQRDITERKQAESELRRYVRNTETMYELSRQIHAGLNLDQVYQDTHQAAGKLMPCDAFVIALLDKAKREIEDVYLWDRN